MTAQSVTKDVALTFIDLVANCNNPFVGPMMTDDAYFITKVDTMSFNSMAGAINIPCGTIYLPLYFLAFDNLITNSDISSMKMLLHLIHLSSESYISFVGSLLPYVTGSAAEGHFLAIVNLIANSDISSMGMLLRLIDLSSDSYISFVRSLLAYATSSAAKGHFLSLVTLIAYSDISSMKMLLRLSDLSSDSYISFVGSLLSYATGSVSKGHFLSFVNLIANGRKCIAKC